MTVTVVIPLAPCAIATGCGAIDKVKVGIGVTVRAMVVVVLKVPEVPVTVIVSVPSVAELLALRVSTLVEVVDFRLKEAVMPVGNPTAERVTLPAKPFNGVMVIVLLPWLPWATRNAPGAADNVKLGAGVTVRLIATVCARLPEVPITVTIAVPVVAMALAVKVRVLLLEAGFGLNAAVTPLGSPDAERVTVPTKPFNGVIVIALVP